MEGLGQVFAEIDGLEHRGAAVVDEVMAGNCHRRRLSEEAKADGYDYDYLLQVTCDFPSLTGRTRLSAADCIAQSAEALAELDLPGESFVHEGLVLAPDKESLNLPFRSTGYAERDMRTIRPSWLVTSWREQGRSCLFLCGMYPPRPQGTFEDWDFDWNTRLMRRGHVVIRPSTEEVHLLESTMR